MPHVPPRPVSLTPHLAPDSAKIAEQLLAHARLCREIAAQSWNEDSAKKLQELADACVRAAGDTCELLTPERAVH